MMYFLLEITLAENDHMTGWKIPPLFNKKHIDSFIGVSPMPVMLVNLGYMDFPSSHVIVVAQV